VSEQTSGQHRKGLIYGTAAYLAWGLFPLYFPLLEPATPLEILANRIVWTLVFVAAVLVVRRQWGWVRPLLRDRRRLLLLTGAALTIAANWGTYIYGVNSDQVVETSLGYFINPLVSIMFGVLLLHERLRKLQWVAVGIGALAVAVLTIDYGRLPWIAVILAFSFGTYGLLKKTIDMGALESLSVETAILALPALGYLVFLTSAGTSALTTGSGALPLLLVSTGIMTALPLLCFGAAATRIPLSWIGLLQYIAPVIQFLIGVVVYREAMPASRWLGFTLVWIALTMLAIESVAVARRNRRDAQDELAVEAAEAH